MSDIELKRKLRKSLYSMQGGDVPDFAAVWANAERQHRAAGSRYQRFAGFAIAAAAAATVFLLWPPVGNDVTQSYITEEDLMSSTRWLAPSDVLLPESRFDIYTEMPDLFEPNNLDEGSLL